MATTVTLSVADDFSRVLDAYVQKTAQAEDQSSQLADTLGQTDKANAQLSDSTQKQTEATDKATKATGEYSQGAASAIEKLTGLNVAELTAAGGMALLAEGLKSSIEMTLDWGETIHKVSLESGQTAEETSKLAVVFGDFGLNVDGLKTMVKALTKEGLAFNLDTIKQLSAEYNALTDPVARNEFAFKNFGRSAMDMNIILSQGPDKLQALADAAGYTGKVINEQGVQSLENFQIKAAQLNDKLDGLKISLGLPLVGELSAAVDGFNNVAKAVGAVDILIEEHTGLITQEQAAARADALAHGDLTAAFHDATPAIQNMLGATRDSSAMAANYSSTLTDLGVQIATITPEQVALNLAVRESADANDAATIKTYAAAQAIRDKTAAAQDAALKSLVQTAVAGQVTKNEETYQAVIDKNADKIQQLKDEIAKYTAAQGENVTVVSKGQYTAEQYTDAQTKLAIAIQRQTEYHGKSQATVMSLALAVDNARDAVDKMGAHMATTNTTTADYSKKIAEDQAALDKLTGANNDARVAMDKANASFVFQQATAGLTGKALLDVALKMGQIDKPTYDAALAIDTAKQTFLAAGGNNNQSALMQFESSLGLVVDKLNGVGPVADTMPAALQPAVDAFNATKDSAIAARDAIESIKDKTITITTNHVDTYTTRRYGSQDNNPNAGMAGGANFVVPPGYPNDSFPMRVQSGEHVIVIPAPGGGATNGGFTINGGVHISAPPGSDGAALWSQMKAAAAREYRSQVMAGAGGMGMS